MPGMTSDTEQTDGPAQTSGYATAWTKWFATIEGGAAPLTKRMLELAQIGGDQQVLDIATGIGEPALSAAAALSPAGRVLGVDLCPEMLAEARARAARAGLDRVSFRQLLAEDLDRLEGPFDSVLCRWGLMFVQDLDLVLKEIRRLLRPGGRFVAAVWAPPDQVPAISLARRVVHADLGLPAPNEGPGTAFALSDIAAFQHRIAGAGFRDVAQEAVPVVYRFASVEAFIAFRSEVSGPLFAAADNLSPARQAQAEAALVEALQAFVTPSGGLELANGCHCISAVR